MCFRQLLQAWHIYPPLPANQGLKLPLLQVGFDAVGIYPPLPANQGLKPASGHANRRALLQFTHRFLQTKD